MLLRDDELLAAVSSKSASSWFGGLEIPTDPYTKSSPIQAASINLRIGDIFLPGKKENEPGSESHPKTEFALKTGQTAVVTTKEIINFPDNIAGIGFPPSEVSFKGLLMTNPGHVDPGYKGVLRFTVINMAKEDFILKRGDRIVRILVFKLNAPAHSDWSCRHPEGSQPPKQEDISRLSEDFVEVSKRAKKIARKQGLKTGAWVAGLLTLGAAILQLLTSGLLSRNAAIEELKTKQQIIEQDLKSRVNLEEKVLALENQLKELERQRNQADSRNH